MLTLGWGQPNVNMISIVTWNKEDKSISHGCCKSCLLLVPANLRDPPPPPVRMFTTITGNRQHLMPYNAVQTYFPTHETSMYVEIGLQQNLGHYQPAARQGSLGGSIHAPVAASLAKDNIHFATTGRLSLGACLPALWQLTDDKHT